MENDIILKQIRERLDQYKVAMQEGRQPVPHSALDDIDTIMLNWEPGKEKLIGIIGHPPVQKIAYRMANPLTDTQIKELADLAGPMPEVVRAVWEEGAKAIRDKIFGNEFNHSIGR